MNLQNIMLTFILKLSTLIWQVNNLLICLLIVLVNVKLHSNKCFKYKLLNLSSSCFCTLSLCTFLYNRTGRTSSLAYSQQYLNYLSYISLIFVAFYPCSIRDNAIAITTILFAFFILLYQPSLLIFYNYVINPTNKRATYVVLGLCNSYIFLDCFQLIDSLLYSAVLYNSLLLMHTALIWPTMNIVTIAVTNY